MSFLTDYLRRRRDRPYVRPWALATPIAVLLVCLPLLRPLHHPGRVSQDEEVRLATIAAIVEHKSSESDFFANRLAIDPSKLSTDSHVIRANHHFYSDQPPMMAFLLAGPYWILHWLGYSMSAYGVLVPYLLTLIGATLPAVVAAAIVYRISRLFELRRPIRTAMAASTVFATGLVSYAVVLNPYAPAAVLVLAAAGCIVHLGASPNPKRGGVWLFLAGACAALAATIEPSTIFFALFLAAAIVTMRLPSSLKAGSVLLFIAGAVGPIFLHSILTRPITGDLLPGYFHPELAKPSAVAPSPLDPSDLDFPMNSTDADSSDFWQSLGLGVGRLAAAMFGLHGLLSHFPVILLGFAGIAAVMHRHWPISTKALAIASVLGLAAVLIELTCGWRGQETLSYANAPLLVFAPITFFWTGVWLRRRHHPAVWSIAGVLLAFSIFVSILGATDPAPPRGYDHFTPIALVQAALRPPGPRVGLYQ